MYLWVVIVKFNMEEDGKCGICGIVGPLPEIQQHFMDTHVEIENHENIPKNTDLGDQGCIENTEYNEENSERNDTHLRWPAEHVLLLIRLVENKQDMFNTSLKKNVWIKISSEITKLTGKKYTNEQVDNKWKGLKKTYKKIKDHNNHTGNGRKTWEFYKAIDSFMGNKPEITPFATCSSNSGLKVNSAGSSSCNATAKYDAGVLGDLDHTVGSSTAATSRSSFTSTLMKKRKKKEDLAEKRHTEKLARYDEFLKLFKLSVEHEIGKKVE